LKYEGALLPFSTLLWNTPLEKVQANQKELELIEHPLQVTAGDIRCIIKKST
jgi:hypothetical protein